MDNLDETIKQLEAKVNQLDQTKTKGGLMNIKGFKFDVNKKKLIMVGVPVSVFVILAVLKPGFVCEQVVDKDDGAVYTKLSLKRVVVATVLLCGVMVGVKYGLDMRKNKKTME